MLKLLLVLACVSSFFSSPALAFQEAAPAGSAEAAAQLEKLIKATATKIYTSPSYQLTVHSAWRNLSPSGLTEGKNRVEVKSNGPKKFRIEIYPESSKEAKLLAVADGSSVIFHLPATNMYEKVMTNDPAAFVRQNPILSQALDGTAVELLVRSDAVQEGMSHIRQVEYLGLLENEDKSKSHRVKFLYSEKYQVQLAFDEKEHLIRSLNRKIEQPLKDGLKLIQTIDSRMEWKLGEKVDDSVFQYTPPAQAKQVSNLQRAMIRGYASIIDQNAPSVLFTMTDGSSFRLEEKFVKPTVIFFWATWSVPSIEELPEIRKLINEYKEKGVQFYGINVGEKVDVVKEFASKAGWTIPIGLDSSSKIADAFDVEQVPSAVVVDAKGKVKAIYTGATAANRQALQKQLESMIAK